MESNMPGSEVLSMKRVYVNEDWCLGCHLCEYYCAFANSGKDNMFTALKNIKIQPNIHVETDGKICFAVSCRHCDEPLCVMNCITGALTRENGVVRINKDKCVQCYTCILSCPYGAIMPADNGVMQKCELCIENSSGNPKCIEGCPNQAIVYEER